VHAKTLVLLHKLQRPKGEAATDLELTRAVNHNSNIIIQMIAVHKMYVYWTLRVNPSKPRCHGTCTCLNSPIMMAVVPVTMTTTYTRGDNIVLLRGATFRDAI
jgi:hypothetical protein